MPRWMLVVTLGAAVLVVATVLLLGGEAWIATRGPATPDPPPPPDDLAVRPIPGDGRAAVTVVWLGDSTAAGVGATVAARTLPEQVALLLGQPVRLTVLAQSGARVADVLRRQMPHLAALHPAEVFISLGANDATHLTRRSLFRRDYGRLLAALPATVQRVVILGVPDMGSPPRLPQPLRAVAAFRGRQLDTDVRNLARRRRAVYVDIAGGSGPEFRRHPARYFAADHYHPDDAGYHLWAVLTADAVRAAVPQPSP